MTDKELIKLAHQQVEAMKLALEALEYASTGNRRPEVIGPAITALREALADQCVCGEPDTFGTHRTDGPCLAEQPAQQEPVAYIRVSKTGHVMVCAKTGDFYKLPDKTLLYTSPPTLSLAQRTWVGLTLKDREALREQFEDWNYPAILVDAVSNMIKEKNT